MSWLVFALSAPVLWAISTHLDKYLVDRYFHDGDVGALMVFTALAGIVLMPFIWFYDSGVMRIPLRDGALIACAGMLYMGAIYFYLRALQTDDASVVAPFFQAGPVFGYILGYLVLGEVLAPVQILGGILIVIGTLFVSIRPSESLPTFKFRLVALMLTCALVLALSSLIFKVFAVRDAFWTTTFWMYAGQAVFGFVLLTIPRFRRQFVGLLKTNAGAVLAVNGANELINIGGGLGARYALTLAPLSLVQAVTSTTTLFVFAISFALAAFLPTIGGEDFSRANLLRKAGAAVLVTIGVALVNR
jgi:uncharacterized membrane protein